MIYTICITFKSHHLNTTMALNHLWINVNIYLRRTKIYISSLKTMSLFEQRNEQFSACLDKMKQKKVYSPNI